MRREQVAAAAQPGPLPSATVELPVDREFAWLKRADELLYDEEHLIDEVVHRLKDPRPQFAVTEAEANGAISTLQVQNREIAALLNQHRKILDPIELEAVQRETSQIRKQ